MATKSPTDCTVQNCQYFLTLLGLKDKLFWPKLLKLCLSLITIMNRRTRKNHLTHLIYLFAFSRTNYFSVLLISYLRGRFWYLYSYWVAPHPMNGPIGSSNSTFSIVVFIPLPFCTYSRLSQTNIAVVSLLHEARNIRKDLQLGIMENLLNWPAAHTK